MFTRLWPILVLFTFVVYPVVRTSVINLQTYEVAVVLGLALAVLHNLERLIHVMVKDRFVLALTALTAVGIVFMWRNLTEMRDYNYTRFATIFPVMTYCLFYVFAATQRSRRFLFNVICVFLLVGLGLNFLVLASPNLPLWRIYLQDKPWYYTTERFLATEEGRVVGLLGNGIFTAIFCACAVLCGLARCTAQPGLRNAVFGWLLIIGGGVFLVYTRTRMPLVLTGILIFYGSWRMFPIARILGKYGNLLLLIALVPLGVELVTGVFAARGSLAREASRMELWTIAFRMLAEDPQSALVGYGIHAFRIRTGGYHHCHNVYLFNAIVYGVPLALAYVTVLIVKAITVGRGLRQQRTLDAAWGVRPDIDTTINYATYLILLLFLLEGFVETTFLNFSRANVFLYALLAISTAANSQVYEKHESLQDQFSLAEEQYWPQGEPYGQVIPQR